MTVGGAVGQTGGGQAVDDQVFQIGGRARLHARRDFLGK